MKGFRCRFAPRGLKARSSLQFRVLNKQPTDTNTPLEGGRCQRACVWLRYFELVSWLYCSRFPSVVPSRLWNMAMRACSIGGARACRGERGERERCALSSHRFLHITIVHHLGPALCPAFRPGGLRARAIAQLREVGGCGSACGCLWRRQCVSCTCRRIRPTGTGAVWSALNE